MLDELCIEDAHELTGLYIGHPAEIEVVTGGRRLHAKSGLFSLMKAATSIGGGRGRCNWLYTVGMPEGLE